eukprot:4263509-Prymnesium_polylepis.1
MIDTYGDGWSGATWQGFGQTLQLTSGHSQSVVFAVAVDSPAPPVPIAPPQMPPLLPPPPAPPTPSPPDFSFSTVATSGGGCNSPTFRGGALAHNGLVVFVPTKGCVGVFHPTSLLFSGVSVESEQRAIGASNNQYKGGTNAPTGEVIFAPRNADAIGIFDAETSSFSTFSIKNDISTNRKFDGCATASNGLVVFAPENADAVGVFDA